MAGAPFYDSVRRRLLVESDVEMLDPVGSFVPFRPKGETYWLVHLPWTNETRRLGQLPPDVRQQVDAQITRYEALRGVLDGCDRAREYGRILPLDESDTERLVQDVADPDVQAAIQAARDTGFSVSEIAFALTNLHDAPALMDVLDGVEVFSVSRLVEEMRARP